MSVFYPENETNTYNTRKFEEKSIVKLNENFEEGINTEKQKKVEMRKDAVILLNLKQKYQKLNDKYKENQRSLREAEKQKKYPHYFLKDGTDIFSFSPKQLKHIYDIYEVSFKELEEFDLNFLSHLPNLAKLDIKFSKIFFSLDSNFLNRTGGGQFYHNLLYLDLPCNNLTNEILNVVQHILSLKALNLMGNRITGDIPENFINLKNLEELNLSYNQIASYFINLGNINEVDKDFLPIQASNIIQREETEIKNSTEIVENSENIGNTVKNSSEVENTPVEISGNIKETFEVWQKYLKTNIQEFYHTLSQLPNLKNLNLSHNKIHFFDIDPFYIQNNSGFRNLEQVDLSYNFIEEEISILLVMNIPKLAWLNVTHNPIVENRIAYENIEYEIFKNKNILLAQEEENNINGVLMKRKQNLNPLRQKHKHYKIKKYKLVSNKVVDKKVKAAVAEIADHRKQLEEEKPEHDVDILGTQEENTKEIKCDIDENLVSEIRPEDMIQNLRRKKEDVFITNEPAIQERPNRQCYPVKVNTYDEFLSLANKCFGKERHYKQKIPLPKAYQRLRFLVSNFQTEAKEADVSSSYMKPTISRILHLDKHSPNPDNLKNDFKLLSKVNKLSGSSSFSLSKSLENI